MTTIYRSPNVIIDGVIWHVTVEQHSNGKRLVCYRWRHNAAGIWSPACKWPGRLPKGLRGFFRLYRHSVKVALVWDRYLKPTRRVAA